MRGKRIRSLNSGIRSRTESWSACLLLAAGLAAFAGTQPGHAETNPPRNLPPSNGTQAAPPPAAGTGSHETGVIQPPAGVDPGMTKPAPNPKEFPTPVVPPPGTSGGNQQVIPK